MIFNLTEYEKAQEEMRILEERLERLQQTHPIGSKGFTKAGIRKMISLPYTLLIKLIIVK